MVNKIKKENLINIRFLFSSYEKASKYLLIILSFVIMCIASMSPLRYDEIDSNVLPIISLQYRGSVLMEQQDIDKARIDFPSLYGEIYTYDDLQSASKLIKVTDETWLSYYYPIYPLFCIPLKIAFSFVGLPQERAFSVTNAVLIIFALYVVFRYLKISDCQKFFTLLLLMVNPIVFYVVYIGYEAFMFSMVTISLVLYYNEHRKSSAFILALAGMSNPTVMAIGIIMILEYVLTVLINNKGKSFGTLVKVNVKETVKYAISFTPCLAQFLTFFNYFGTINAGSNSMMSTEYYGARFLTYLFDPTVGLFTFAPFHVLFYIYCIIITIFKHKWKALVRGTFFLATLSGFSLMFHINCGLIYCCRYLIWSFPALMLFVAEELDEAIIHKFNMILSNCVMISATSCLILFNFRDDNPYYFNNSTKVILNHCPAIYNPYSATFYCRTLHLDGAYDKSTPAYYQDSNGSQEIRKIIFKANQENADILKNELMGNEDSERYLTYKINNIHNDEKFHYINLPRNGKYQLKKKPAELRLGQEIYFDGTENDAHKYFTQGMSGTETDFAWTDGNVIKFRAFLPQYDSNNLNMKINVNWTFGSQTIIVKSNGNVLEESNVSIDKPIDINIPAQCVTNGIIELSIELPNAASPQSLGQSTDNRELALAIKSFSFYCQ